ncbi:MAG: T9SS type A sorting domain-containing protein [Bacteroidota bacterium]
MKLQNYTKIISSVKNNIYILGLLSLILISTNAFSTDYYWVGGTGSSNDAAHWSLTSNGLSQSVVPVSTDNVFFDANSGTAPYTVTIAGNTEWVNLTGTGFTGTFNIAAFTLDINGTFSNAGAIDFTGNGFIRCSGTVSSIGTLDNAEGTFIYDGAGQTIIATTYYNLTVGGSGIKTLAGDVTVKNTLDFADATKIATVANTLTIGTESGPNGSITGAASDRYIIAYDNAGAVGKVKMFIASAASITYSYPIGDANHYVPFAFTLDAATLDKAYLTVYTKDAKITGMHDEILNYLNRFWSYVPEGITDASYDLSLKYDDGDFFGTTEASLLPIKKSIVNGIATWYVPSESNDLIGVTEQGNGGVNAGTNTLTWSGLSTFSEVGGAGDQSVLLPVELISFNTNCSDNGVNITWSTSSETNNNYFTIEKSIDLVNWTVLTKVSGAENSNSLLNYSVLDDLSDKTVYYRLSQTDFDGKSETFNTLACNCKKQSTETFKVFPIPTDKDLNIEIETVENEKLTVEIYNSLGQKLYTSEFNTIDGINTIQLSDLNLSRNYYQLRVVSSSGNLFNQVIVVN